MLNNIFYCPRCGKTEINLEIKYIKTTWVNLRGGYGRAIYHIECPECKYDLSGYMLNCNKDEVQYVKYVVGMYSR